MYMLLIEMAVSAVCLVMTDLESLESLVQV